MVKYFCDLCSKEIDFRTHENQNITFQTSSASFYRVRCCDSCYHDKWKVVTSK